MTVEAGNFATLANDEEYNQRKDLLLGFYREQSYDAIVLGAQEMTSPVSVWQSARDAGLPVVCANLFLGKRSKKPLFEPYRWVERAGLRMAAVGLLSERALLGCPDSAEVRVESMFKMQKLMRKVLKRSDYITLIGDFTANEADSLAKTYPFVNMIVSSNATVNRAHAVGNVLIAPCGAKGYYGEFVDVDIAVSDSLAYRTVKETLDGKIPADTLYEHRVAVSGIRSRK